jgi:hypothetical protein
MFTNLYLFQTSKDYFVVIVVLIEIAAVASERFDDIRKRKIFSCLEHQ